MPNNQNIIETLLTKQWPSKHPENLSNHIRTLKKKLHNHIAYRGGEFCLGKHHFNLVYSWNCPTSRFGNPLHQNHSCPVKLTLHIKS